MNKTLIIILLNLLALSAFASQNVGYVLNVKAHDGSKVEFRTSKGLSFYLNECDSSVSNNKSRRLCTGNINMTQLLRTSLVHRIPIVVEAKSKRATSISIGSE